MFCTSERLAAHPPWCTSNACSVERKTSTAKPQVVWVWCSRGTATWTTWSLRAAMLWVQIQLFCSLEGWSTCMAWARTCWLTAYFGGAPSALGSSSKIPCTVGGTALGKLDKSCLGWPKQAGLLVLKWAIWSYLVLLAFLNFFSWGCNDMLEKERENTGNIDIHVAWHWFFFKP